jgi:beta-galactosidase/beta-glucuronidase
VARDKNHPSVVLWSIANEPESQTDAARAYFEPLFALTQELDPSRPVGFANMVLAPHGECRVSELADVIMLNRYFGWYIHTGDLASAEHAWLAELEAWAADGKPIVITEYGADTVQGLHGRRAAVERGVPDRCPRDEPPRVRPRPRSRGRARVELRGLRDRARHLPRRRQP